MASIRRQPVTLYAPPIPGTIYFGPAGFASSPAAARSSGT